MKGLSSLVPTWAHITWGGSLVLSRPSMQSCRLATMRTCTSALEETVEFLPAVLPCHVPFLIRGVNGRSSKIPPHKERHEDALLKGKNKRASTPQTGADKAPITLQTTRVIQPEMLMPLSELCLAIYSRGLVSVTFLDLYHPLLVTQ